MGQDEIEEKRSKALRYAGQPERFVILRVGAEMRSNHGVRTVEFDGARWHCVCPFYEKHATCSHVLALQEILRRAGLGVSESE